ncbi:carbohydrate ABC transporter permease [Mangrovicoccus sp. HB161399]|uniref:carbohydrate ABC transporter permease n=1 Tax=Mangrovicoccus sp. HB161399 TaxID=2720392 RepID=UPI001556DEEA|nr:carbohydrate ABC transporter permease [Mangrovicoccus sp. HB161399]
MTDQPVPLSAAPAGMRVTRPRLRRMALRAGLYAMLAGFAAFYLLPLFVMVTTSLKGLEEIQSGSLVALPREITFEAWSKAWSGTCTGIQCEGLRPFFWNSVAMAVPAVILSTLIGALNGYALSHWRFRGSNILFGAILFGCFLPFQVVLMPMARVLGLLGLAGSIPGLVLVHVVYGLGFTTLFFRNFYVTVPGELVRAAKIDGAGFFRIFASIFLPLSLPIVTVTVIWQFTNVWNDFLFGVSFSQAGSQPVTVALNNIVNSTTGVKEYNVDMAAAIIAGLPTLGVYVLAGKYFIRGLTAGAVKG